MSTKRKPLPKAKFERENVVEIIPPSRSPTRLEPKHLVSPREELKRQIGTLPEGFQLFHNTVLVAVYIRPSTATLGGADFHLSDKTRKEDEYQGTVGLVIAKGPAAFLEDDKQRFYGCNVDIGDWVFFRASNGERMLVNGVLCRRVPDVLIEGKIPHPDYVY